MAQKVITLRVSDLSGKELADGEGETITFSVGADSYQLDLTSDEAGKFYDDLKKYTEVATKTAGRGVRKSAGRSKSGRSSDEISAVREWANANGFEVAERGRIKTEVYDAYDAAH